ncbi:MAG TPA: prepilin-type N-terminal cleavage/methylation domain-containing protein [Candidatus Angelobacter sp.]|nr:prepilin-type N-terminal cleavage/methylation domain-containing protein [Candidatus Angelobacter sp.]
MKLNDHPLCSTGRSARGFTLMEILVASALGTVVVAIILAAFNYSGTSFSAMGNYEDLDRASRGALDVLSREIRNSSAVISATADVLTLTNATQQKIITLTYDPTGRTLTLSKTGQADDTLLTQCDQWTYSLYSRVPYLTSTNILFYGATNGAGATDVTMCKLINMNWKCSRTIFGSKRNTESIQTAQLVLRDKVK